MFWFLLLLGTLLLLVGVWGGPRLSRPADEKDQETKGRKDPWEVLTEPLPQEEELIKLPEPKPWYLPGGDRRFRQGLLVGLGAGLVVAGLVTLLPSGEDEPDLPGPVVQEPGPAAGGNQQGGQGAEQPDDSGEPAGGQDEEPAGQEEPDGGKGDADKPEAVLFVIEEGEFPSTIAANLRAQGLIADEDAFLSRVTQLGVDTSLRAGSFLIPTGADLDAVISALTE